MTLDKVAIIPSIGIGDALMMMVASHRLYCQGYEVTTFSSAILPLQPWFSLHFFQQRPSIELLEQTLKDFDLIVFQHENTPFAQALLSLYHDNKLKALSVFYAKYEEKKHFPLTPLDRVFHDKKPMVDNIAKAISSILGLNHISKNNGLTLPDHLLHRRFKNRVLLHPTSQGPAKIWPAEKFLALAKLLEDEGFCPVFTVSPTEKPYWDSLVQGDYLVPLFPSLSDFASYALESGYMIGNDSGLGHLCSNLQIPTLIVAGKKNHISLWRPGWYRGDVITPPWWIPNFKGSRLRERHWHNFIQPKDVFKKFLKLVSKETF